MRSLYEVIPQRDTALLLKLHGGPLALRHERPRQSIHVHTEVVQAAKVNVGRDRAQSQGIQDGLAFGFDDDLRQQRAQRLVFGGRFPTVLIRSLLGVQQRLKVGIEPQIKTPPD